ncbi:hypothetical protein ASD24_24965 [Paenibacillus sp. Root52]|uniref:hypothetical protein n=1 Tax=Paenibacillus sp. Root52 TaxID=1736552 RepID=UPI0006F86169|nr:hypothetical protein [Paenibacillus sp. Root52]KQY90159.1 hypothetical protein ASD24_24965 [Paenibacillus sp. Root52]
MLIRIFYFFMISSALLSITGCTSETSATQEMAQTIMKEDQNSDIFILESILYKKVETINKEQLRSIQTAPYGSITSSYEKKNTFQSGMASILPTGTQIYRSIAQPEHVYSNDRGTYTLYKSVPEG